MFTKQVKKEEQPRVEFVKPEFKKPTEGMSEQEKALLILVEQFQVFNNVHSPRGFDGMASASIAASQQNKLFAIWASIDFLRSEITEIGKEHSELLKELINEIRMARLGEQSAESEQSPQTIH